MEYTKEAFDKAEFELAARRRRARALSDERIKEVTEKCIAITKLENTINEKGIKLSRLALNKGPVNNEEFSRIENELENLEKQKKNELTKCGFLANYLDDVYLCNKCKDSGYIGGEMCGCLKKLLSEYDYKKAISVPKFSFEQFNLNLYSDDIIPQFNTSARAQMESIYNFCLEYVSAFSSSSENLLMFGGAGLGKTFLCSCIANKLSEKGFSVIMQSAYNIFEIISKNKFSYKTDYSDDIEKFYNCDLLILDDLGTEFITEYSVSALFDIINTRLNLKKPTIINANLSLKNIEAKYSDRIVSRLLTYTHLLFLGTDIRSMNI